MGDVAIRVENLSKQYRIGGPQARYKTLRESLVGAARAPIRRAGRLLRGEAATDHQETIWALKDVSFEVKHGEVLGIIGRNGAGKSTLLKILSRITAPTEGTVDLYGRVGSLLEVGTGFHPELTGRENVYLNGAILGMKRAEIEQKFDEIVAFAELEKFLDTPVKHYSSGMYVRLAFAVAAHLDPEILLVDEVLAVGDAAFQKKCLGKMGEVAGEGRTVLFVSHNMAAVMALCEQSVLLASGQFACHGLSDEVIGHHLRGRADRGEAIFEPGMGRRGDGRARYTRARILDQSGQPVGCIPMGHGLTIEMEFDTSETIGDPVFGVSLRTPLNERLVGWRTRETHGTTMPVSAGGLVMLHIAQLNLLPGLYYIALGLSDGYEQVDLIEAALEFEVIPWPVYPTGLLPKSADAVFFTHCSWQFDYR